MTQPVFLNRSGLSSSIFDETPTFRKKEPKKSFPSEALANHNEGNGKLLPPKNLTPVSSASITNPSGKSSENIVVGDRVRHDRFGVGKVIFLDGTDPQNIKAKVNFSTEGEKNLILKFAKLTKIE